MKCVALITSNKEFPRLGETNSNSVQKGNAFWIYSTVVNINHANVKPTACDWLLLPIGVDVDAYCSWLINGINKEGSNVHMYVGLVYTFNTYLLKHFQLHYAKSNHENY